MDYFYSLYSFPTQYLFNLYYQLLYMYFHLCVAPRYDSNMYVIEILT